LAKKLVTLSINYGLGINIPKKLCCADGFVRCARILGYGELVSKPLSFASFISQTRLLRSFAIQLCFEAGSPAEMTLVPKAQKIRAKKYPPFGGLRMILSSGLFIP